MADETKPAKATRPAKGSTTTKVADPAPAKDFAASGAVIEDAIVGSVDMTHPAVDANPRSGTTVEQNQIDFNDPTITGAEAVAQNLARG